MKEIWCDVKGYEGLYQVSNKGRVKSLARVDSLGRRVNERILSPGKDRDGYLFVVLTKNGEHKKYLVHRLVLMAFNPVDNIDNLQVNHIDEVKTNNHLSNLEWCNSLYNNTYNDRHKKIAEKNSIPLVQIDASTNKIVNVWKSSKDAAREGGFTKQNIIACCKGRLKTHGGFRWCYLYSYISKIDPRIKKVILFGKEYLV